MSDSAKYGNRYQVSDAARFGFTPDEFGRLLEAQVQRVFPNGASGKERERLIDALHLKDLVLAQCCARGNAIAWDDFVSLYRPKLYPAAVAIARDDAMGRELADSIYGDLFGLRIEPDGNRISKLYSYSGRGSLEGWLKTLLAQEFVNRYRSTHKLVSFEETVESAGENAETFPSSLVDQQKLEHATDNALAALSVEEQFILAAYHLDGRTLAEIGRMLAVHESTVSRRIEKTTTALRKRIVKELRAGGLSKKAAEDLLKIDVRDLGIDVRGRLAQERSGESF